MAVLLRSSGHECCHDISVVTAHVDHAVGFGIFVVFQVSSLGYDVINLFLGPLRRSVGRLFHKILSVHRVECCKILQHQPMFQPITSFVSTVECVFANTNTFCSATKSQSNIEVSSNNRYVSFVCFSIVLYIFFNVVVNISLMRWWFSTIVAVMAARSLMHSVSIFLCLHFVFNMIPTPCWLSYFPAPMNMCFGCVSQSSDLSGLHVSFIHIATHLWPSSSQTISSTLSLEFY